MITTMQGTELIKLAKGESDELGEVAEELASFYRKHKPTEKSRPMSVFKSNYKELGRLAGNFKFGITRNIIYYSSTSLRLKTVARFSEFDQGRMGE